MKEEIFHSLYSKKEKPLTFLSTIPETLISKKNNLHLIKKQISILDPCNLFYLNSIFHCGKSYYGEITGDYIGSILFNIVDKEVIKEGIHHQLLRKILDTFLLNIKNFYSLTSEYQKIMPFNMNNSNQLLQNFLAILVEYELKRNDTRTPFKMVIISDKIGA